MEAHLQEMRQGKQGVRQFTKNHYSKTKDMSSNFNFQLNPGSLKAVVVFTTCLLIVIELFK